MILCFILGITFGAIVTSVIWNIVIDRMFIKYYENVEIKENKQ